MIVERTGMGVWVLLAALLFAATQVDAGNGAARETPAELGHVEWLRNFETAASISRASDKPSFLLFQEVPGCQTCVNLGQSVLSHPLLMEAIENESIPLAILNNKAGDDRFQYIQQQTPKQKCPPSKRSTGVSTKPNAAQSAQQSKEPKPSTTPQAAN